MSIIVSVFVILVYIGSPIAGKIVLLLVNTIVPDPIPFADEFIMWIGLYMNLIRVANVMIFIKTHKLLCISIFIIVIIILVLHLS